MDFTRPVTPKDVAQLQAADQQLQAMGIDTDATGYTVPIVTYLNQNPGVAITAENILAFVNANKNLFTFRNATEREYDELAVRFSEPDRDLIARTLRILGYDTTENLLWNWNLTAKAFVARGYQQVTADNVKLTITNFAAGPNGNLLRRPATRSKFDSAQAVKEYEQRKMNPKQRNQNELIRDGFSNFPDRKFQEESNQAEAQTTVQEDWKKKLDRMIYYVQSNVDRQAFEQRFAKPIGYDQQGNPDWESTYHVASNAIERRKHERDRLATV